MSADGPNGIRALAPRPATCLAVAALAAAVVVVVGLHYAGHGAGALDRDIGSWLMARFRRNQSVALAVSDLGNTEPVLLASLVLVLFELSAGSRRGVALAVCAPVVALAVTEFALKPAFHRPHHVFHDTASAYPSGHATAVWSVLCAAVLLVPRQLANRAGRVAVVAGCAVIGGAVPVALVAAGYHYATDTVGGAGVAVATVLALAVAIDAAAGISRR